MGTLEANKDLIRRYTDLVWKGESVESAFYAPDPMIHNLTSPSGVADLSQTAAYFRAALPDLSLQSTTIFGQDDRVMQYYTVIGTHTGAALFNFPASGRTLSVSGENIFRIVDGKIVERWSIIDAATLFGQLSAQ